MKELGSVPEMVVSQGEFYLGGAERVETNKALVGNFRLFSDS